MSNYRRVFVPGGTYFFTVVMYRREPWLIEADAREALRDAIERCRATRPFTVDAWVLMPDHLHTVWTLPPSDTNYSIRWSQIKRTVSVLLANKKRGDWINDSKRAQRESTLWQRRFYEHAVRDDADFARCVDYVHSNPVKHEHATRVADWPWSTFHRYVESGVYSVDWMGDTSEEFGE
ncbi:MAG: transposase [Betaproteobacteria bacterium]|nr:MAG: transposase [Betaproteobacteria bacterium]